jgi:hypothetical protein
MLNEFDIAGKGMIRTGDIGGMPPVIPDEKRDSGGDEEWNAFIKYACWMILFNLINESDKEWSPNLDKLEGISRIQYGRMAVEVGELCEVAYHAYHRHVDKEFEKFKAEIVEVEREKIKNELMRELAGEVLDVAGSDPKKSAKAPRELEKYARARARTLFKRDHSKYERKIAEMIAARSKMINGGAKEKLKKYVDWYGRHLKPEKLGLNDPKYYEYFVRPFGGGSRVWMRLIELIMKDRDINKGKVARDIISKMPGEIKPFREDTVQIRKEKEDYDYWSKKNRGWTGD